MKAWTFQDPKQVKKVGEERASWYVGWYDPAGTRKGKSCGPGVKGKRLAEKERDRIAAQLITGTYDSRADKTWTQFREEYEEKIVPGLAPRSRPEVLFTLNHFERICHPNRMSAIRTQTIDDFIAARRKEPGKKKGDLVSPATLNKDLRNLKAALRTAARWDYLARLPTFDMEREPRKLPTYITPEHFALLYTACEHARLPRELPYPAADWWRGVIVTGYMTGWRISDILGLRREDLDLEAGTLITRWEDNKGKRDEIVKVHPVVLEHLRKVPSFDPHVFPWGHTRNTLQDEFARLQELTRTGQNGGGIDLPCRGKHKHSRFCSVYGFHDLRRAFATQNHKRLTGEALQTLMRHKSYATTQRYINMTSHLDDAVGQLHVPDVLKGSEAG